MQLDDRKRKILQAVIKDYIKTAEPVGSCTISRNHIQNLSSATIRNEMADLEDLGYLYQPHSSAGRIPSDLGYRVYVDSMLSKYKLTITEMVSMHEMLVNKMKEANNIVTELSSVLAHLSSYAAVSVASPTGRSVIDSVQVLYINNYRVVVLLILKDGTIKNRMFESVGITESQTLTLTSILSSRLNGLSVSDITLDLIVSIKMMFADNKVLIDEIMEFISLAIGDDNHSFSVDGSVNLLNYPEYSDVEKAKKILNFMHDENNIRSLAKIPLEENDVSILIGRENPFEELGDCSMAVLSYNIGGKAGRIALVGPKRMDYSKTVSILEYLKEELDSSFGGKERSIDNEYK
ncbi:MAG: heat-inducible transcriptional repressor HrcA [Monoglobales bacterium]